MADQTRHAEQPTTPTNSRTSPLMRHASALRIPALVTSLTIAAFAAGANWRSSDAADPAKADQTPSPKYAQVFLDLAEAQMAYAERMNRQSSGTFSREQVAEIQRSIDMWNDLLKQEKLTGEFDRIAAMQGLAERHLQRAQIAVANAESVNQRVPGTFPPEQLKELRASVALAQLDANAGRSIQDADETAQLRWRVAVLEDELLMMRKEVDLIRRTQQ